MLGLRWLLAQLAVFGLWLVVLVGTSVAGPTEVRQIQQRLTELGYDPGPVDGAWGGKTEQAVRKYLSAEKIDPSTVFPASARNEIAIAKLLSGQKKQSRQDTGRPVITLQAHHSEDPDYLVYSPDGRLLATASPDQTVKLWDATSHHLIRTFYGHEKALAAIAFTRDSKELVTVDDGTGVRIWNIVTGRLARSFQAHKKNESTYFSGAVLSPHGEDLMMWSFSGGIEFRDIASGQYRAHTRIGFGASVGVYSHDGSQVALGTKSGQLLILNAKSTAVELQASIGSSPIRTLSFSPDGQMIAVGTKDSLTLHDSKTADLLRSLGGSNEFKSFVFSPEGRHLLTCRVLQPGELWETATGNLIKSSPDNVTCPLRLAISPDGQQVAYDNKIWHLPSNKLKSISANWNSTFSQVVRQPKSARIVAAGTYGLSSWNTETGELVQNNQFDWEPYLEMAFSHDGSKLVAEDVEKSELHVFNVQNNALEKRISGKRHRPDPETHMSLAFVDKMAISPNGKFVVTRNRNKTASIWSIDSGREVETFDAHEEGYTGALSISPDGSRIAAVGESETILLWRFDGKSRPRKLKREEKNHSIHALAFSPRGNKIASGTEDRLDIWNVGTGKRLLNFIDTSLPLDGLQMHNLPRRAHTDKIHVITFSADGRYVASGSEDNTAKIWDARNGRLIRRLIGHQGSVNAVTFLRNRNQLLTASEDGTMKIWDVRNKEALATLFQTEKGWLAFTPEGYFAGTRDAAHALVVVRGLEPFSIDQFYQALYRPDLVREKLAGDPGGKVREAAAKLDLDKIIDSGDAPNIAIGSPDDGKSVKSDKLTVEAKITETGGGIGRIEWRVNGLTRGVDTKRGFERVGGDAQKVEGNPVTVRQDLWLEPGRNTIEVVAYNAKNLIASEPAKITVTWDGQSSNAPPRLHVLAVGINDYFDSRLKLNFAVPDAKAVGAALGRAGDELYEEVSVTSILNGEATANGLESAFERLAVKVRPRDVFVFFLAGHGKTVDGRYYFIPQDFRYESPLSIINSGIGQDQWQRWLSKIPARKSILLYDTCESGSLTGTRIATRGLERVAALEKLTRAVGRTVLSAATDDAPALEGYRGHGVFTYALLDALNRSDANKNDLIEVTELAGHVDARVPEISQRAFGQRQIPQMNIVGSNFPLAKKTTALAYTPPSEPPSIPIKPTHVVLQPADLFLKPGGAGTVTRKLKPGTTLTLVKSDNGWTLVAKDGKELGYVAAQMLIPMQ